MKDLFYGDNRDLVKWSVLFHLAAKFGAKCILQVAFLTASQFGRVLIDGRRALEIPKKVKDHFRDIHDVRRMANHGGIAIEVFDKRFEPKARDDYVERACRWARTFKGKCIVLLDPDTGLQPEKSRASDKHVRKSEARTIWDRLKPGNVFVFYQHRTKREKGRAWIGEKKRQLEKALELRDGSLRIAEGAGKAKKGAKADGIARDVVFYFAQKP